MRRNPHEGRCLARFFVIFPRSKNDFYPSDPPEEREDWRPDLGRPRDHKLCRVCGCVAEKQCAGCKRVDYCSREHQTLDWKRGGHRDACKSGAGDSEWSRVAGVLLPEFELNLEMPEEGDFPGSGCIS